jgi:hypothetical protein
MNRTRVARWCFASMVLVATTLVPAWSAPGEDVLRTREGRDADGQKRPKPAVREEATYGHMG